MKGTSRWRWAPGTLGLVGVVVACFVAQRLSGEWWRDVEQLRRAFAYSARELTDGQWWRLDTVSLVHDPLDVGDDLLVPGLDHLLNQVPVLLLAGAAVERRIGTGRFVAFVVVATALGSTGVLLRNPTTTYAAGSSITSLALIGAFVVLSVTHPRRSRATWIGVAVGIGYAAFATIGGSDISTTSHVAGLLAGALVALPLDPARSHRTAVLGVAAAVASIAVVVPVRSAQLRHLDPRVVAAVDVGPFPASVVREGGSLVVGFGEDFRRDPVRVDPTSLQVRRSEPAPALAPPTGGGITWTCDGHGVRSVDAATGRAERRVGLGDGSCYDVHAAGDGEAWAAVGGTNRLVAIDTSGRVVDTVDLGVVVPVALAVDDDTLWVADYWGGRLLEVDLRPR